MCLLFLSFRNIEETQRPGSGVLRGRGQAAAQRHAQPIHRLELDAPDGLHGGARRERPHRRRVQQAGGQLGTVWRHRLNAQRHRDLARAAAPVPRQGPRRCVRRQRATIPPVMSAVLHLSAPCCLLGRMLHGSGPLTVLLPLVQRCASRWWAPPPCGSVSASTRLR
jgi:hypothetical protein